MGVESWRRLRIDELPRPAGDEYLFHGHRVHHKLHPHDDRLPLRRVHLSDELLHEPFGRLLFGYLLESGWKLAATTNVSATTNWIEWTDSGVTDSWVTLRFYAAGNADLDSDGDGYPDARERFLYPQIS